MGVHVDFKLEGALADQVAAVTAGHGRYRDAEDDIRDLIRRDAEREHADFEAFRTELQAVFAVPEAECSPFDADAFRARMRERHG